MKVTQIHFNPKQTEFIGICSATSKFIVVSRDQESTSFLGVVLCCVVLCCVGLGCVCVRCIPSLTLRPATGPDPCLLAQSPRYRKGPTDCFDDNTRVSRSALGCRFSYLCQSFIGSLFFLFFFSTCKVPWGFFSKLRHECLIIITGKLIISPDGPPCSTTTQDTFIVKHSKTQKNQTLSK